MVLTAPRKPPAALCGPIAPGSIRAAHLPLPSAIQPHVDEVY